MTDKSYNKTRLTCDICGKDFLNARNLRCHALIHSGSKPFWCSCGWRFRQKNNLKYHQRKYGCSDTLGTTGIKQIGYVAAPDAVTWNVLFTGESALSLLPEGQTHNKVTEDAIEDQIEIITQSAVSCQPADDKRHHEKSNEQQSIMLQQLHATPTENTPGTSKPFYQSLEDDNSQLKCHVCGMEFIGLSGFSQHMQNSHTERKFVCNICGKAFLESQSLKQHSVVHSVVKPFRCRDCGSHFIYRQSLNIHRRIHHCTSNGRIKHLSPRNSQTCNKSIPKSVTDESEAHHRTRLTCDICGKNFANARNLRCHSMIHTGSKPFSCSCGWSFREKRNVKYHQRTHGCSDTLGTDGTGYVAAPEAVPLAVLCAIESTISLLPEGQTGNEVNEHATENQIITQSAIAKHADDKQHHEKSNEQQSIMLQQLHATCTENTPDTSKPFYQSLEDDNSQLKCHVCGMEFIGQSGFSQHMQNHSTNPHTERKFVCNICGKSFQESQSLKQHSVVHLTVNKPFGCADCGSHFKYKQSLDIHRRIHHCTGNDRMKYLSPRNSQTCNESIQKSVTDHLESEAHHRTRLTCDICGKNFVNAKTLKRHALIHSGSKPFSCSCGWRCRKKYNLKGHQRKYGCSDNLGTTGIEQTGYVAAPDAVSCSVLYAIESAISPRPEVTDLQQGSNYRCPICGKQFSDQSLLSAHLIYHNGSSLECRVCHGYHLESEAHHRTRLTCDICGKNFVNASNLKRHTLIHSGSKQFSCSCGWGFTQKNNLKLHQRKHGCSDTLYTTGIKQTGYVAAPDAVTCSVLSTGESALSLLTEVQTHNKVNDHATYDQIITQSAVSCQPADDKHHHEKSNEQPVCGMEFNGASGFSQHMQNSHTERQFVCNICGKSFQESQSLKQHSTVHPVSRPFSAFWCPDCGSHFKYKQSLDIHRRIHHCTGNDSMKDLSPQKSQPCNALIPKSVTDLQQEDATEDQITTQGAVSCQHADDKRHHEKSNEQQSIMLQQLHAACTENTPDTSKPFYQSLEDDNSQLKCHVCGMEFIDQSEFSQHMQKHSTNSHTERKFVCNICGKSFLESQSLKQHSVVHSVVKPFRCRDCGSHFKYRQSLYVHRMNRRCTSNGMKKYLCKLCYKSFMCTSDLALHLELHKKADFTCKICSRSFLSSYSLKHHWRLVHFRVQNYSCGDCGMRFKYPMSLKQHQCSSNAAPSNSLACNESIPESVTHPQQDAAGEYKCHICGTQFPDQSLLFSHLLYHDAKPHLCQVCKRCFSKSFELLHHIKSHDKTRLTCNICGKIFLSAKNLTIHTLIHSGSKQFSCSCGRSFKQKHHLKDHQRTCCSSDILDTTGIEQTGYVAAPDAVPCSVLCIGENTLSLLPEGLMSPQNNSFPLSTSPGGSSNLPCTPVEYCQSVGQKTCRVCGHLFTSETELRQHVMTIHSYQIQDNETPAEAGGVQFGSMHDRFHMKDHTRVGNLTEFLPTDILTSSGTVTAPSPVEIVPDSQISEADGPDNFVTEHRVRLVVYPLKVEEIVNAMVTDACNRSDEFEISYVGENGVVPGSFRVISGFFSFNSWINACKVKESLQDIRADLTVRFLDLNETFQGVIESLKSNCIGCFAPQCNVIDNEAAMQSSGDILLLNTDTKPDLLTDCSTSSHNNSQHFSDQDDVDAMTIAYEQNDNSSEFQSDSSPGTLTYAECHPVIIKKELQPSLNLPESQNHTPAYCNAPLSHLISAGRKRQQAPVVGITERSEDSNSPQQTNMEHAAPTIDLTSKQQTKARFANLTADELDTLLNGKLSKNSKNLIKSAMATLDEYTRSKGMNIDELDQLASDAFDKFLGRFFVEARKQDGSLYATKSLLGLRYGIAQHFKKTRGVDIMRSEDFGSSRELFAAALTQLKQAGKGAVMHKKPLTADDFNKLYSSNILNTSNPKGLQNKVFVDLMIHLCNRGRENLRKMTRDDFIVQTDPAGHRYVSMKDKQTKNHRADSEISQSGRMYEMPGSERCPVASLEKYIAKLNPECPAFWQRPKENPPTGQHCWYDNIPVGQRILFEKMKFLSQTAQLSCEYTNHCLRATCITALDQCGHEARHIMNVSGQKCEASIRSYSRNVTDATKRDMSLTLSSQPPTQLS